MVTTFFEILGDITMGSYRKRQKTNLDLTIDDV